MKRIPVATLLTAGAVVIVLLVYALTFQVRFSEVAVKVRLGQVAAIIKEPGLYPRWPWPIESVRKYDQRLRTLDTLEGEVKTQDGKNIIVGVYAFWRIEDPLTFSIGAGTPRRAEEQLRARINQRRAAVIGNEKLSAFVNLNEELVNETYERVAHALLAGKQGAADGEDRSLQEGVLADFGIRLEKVDLRRTSLPEETTQSVSAQMIAERQREAERYRAEGRSRAQTITAQAEAAARQIAAFAERKAAEQAATGIEASTRIVEQIAAEDVEFFEWLRWLDALRVSLQQKSTIFLDHTSPLYPPFAEPHAAASQPAGG